MSERAILTWWTGQLTAWPASQWGPSSAQMEAFTRLPPPFSWEGVKMRLVGPSAKILRRMNLGNAQPGRLPFLVEAQWLVERTEPVTPEFAGVTQAGVAEVMSNNMVRAGLHNVGVRFVTYNPSVHGSIAQWTAGTIANTATRDAPPSVADEVVGGGAVGAISDITRNIFIGIAVLGAVYLLGPAIRKATS